MYSILVVCMYVHYMHAWCLQVQEGVSDILDLELEGCKPPCTGTYLNLILSKSRQRL